MTDETRGNAYFTMANWLIHKYRVPPSVLTKPGGRKVIAVVFMLLFHRNEAREDAYPGVGTLARLIGTAPNTVRAALHLAHDLGLLDWTERSGQSHVFTFPKLELVARMQKGTPPAKVPTTKAVPTPAPPVDETALEPPDVDPALPDFDWADMIAKDARFYHVLDGVRSVRKQLLYHLGQGMPKAAIIAAFKGNKAMRKSWEILEPLLPDKAEVRRREEERKAAARADEHRRLAAAERARTRRLRQECDAERTKDGTRPVGDLVKQQIAALKKAED